MDRTQRQQLSASRILNLEQSNLNKTTMQQILKPRVSFDTTAHYQPVALAHWLEIKCVYWGVLPTHSQLTTCRRPRDSVVHPSISQGPDNTASRPRVSELVRHLVRQLVPDQSHRSATTFRTNYTHSLNELQIQRMKIQHRCQARQTYEDSASISNKTDAS